MKRGDPNSPWAKDINYWSYHSQRGRYVAFRSEWSRNRRRHWIKKWMGNKGCMECKTKDERVLTLDHINTKDKLFDVSQGYKKPIKTIMEEVRKCQVLCHNCHQIKTVENKDNQAEVQNKEQREKNFYDYHKWEVKDDLRTGR